MSNERIYEVFEEFSWLIYEDCKARQVDGHLVDDLWDESIHFK